MSLDNCLLFPPGYGFDDTSVPDAAFTLTLDDLSTRFAEYNGAAASIKFKLTTTDGGGSKTTASFVYLDASQGTGNAAGSLDAIGDVATLIQTQLNALAGYSGVTVNGVATVPGDQWDFTITFPGALGVTDLDFHASSQWYPTITLVETVAQQGSEEVPEVIGQPEIVTITAAGGDDTTLDSNGNGVTLDSEGVFASTSPAMDWTVTSDGNPGTFQSNADAPFFTTFGSGNGSVQVDQEGIESVPGQSAEVEVHHITPHPVNPTGGTYKPFFSGSAIDFDADATTIASTIGFNFDPLGAEEPGIVGTLDAGQIIVTSPTAGELGDTVLSPVSVDLTAPEVTHSIAEA